MHYHTGSGSIFDGLSSVQRSVRVKPSIWASQSVARRSVIKGAFFSLVIATGVLCMAYTQPASAQERRIGVIPHAPLLKTAVPDTANQEVAVYHVEYEPGGVNPRHLHPAAVTFHILSGTGIWQEEGQPPVTLRAGDSLLVPAGTIHTHWNPSATEKLRFLEFIVAEKDKGRSIPKPLKD